MFTEMISVIFLLQQSKGFIYTYMQMFGKPLYVLKHLCMQFVTAYTANSRILVVHRYVVQIVQFAKDA